MSDLKFAALFAAITLAALWAHLEGNPTAINGVIGAGVLTLVFIAFAALEHRH